LNSSLQIYPGEEYSIKLMAKRDTLHVATLSTTEDSNGNPQSAISASQRG